MTLEQGKRICSQTAESANERSADHEKRKEKLPMKEETNTPLTDEEFREYQE